MPELEDILHLAGRARARGEEICLVSVVGVEGSSYRKPGARLLLTRGGLRAGTISGGCLEGEVSKKAWWLTEKGPKLQRYSSFFDDDAGVAYGLGCGGTVILLLERGAAAEAAVEALRIAVKDRQPVVVLTQLGEDAPGTRLVMTESGTILYAAPQLSGAARAKMEALARETLSSGARHRQFSAGDGTPEIALFCERIAPPPSLWIFGAGDDVRPLAELAWSLDWHVTVADGRGHLARRERFPHAQRVLRLEPEKIADVAGEIGPEHAVVLMTHSYEQDRGLLAQLLRQPLAYLGVLGPRRRTRHILEQLTRPESGTISMTADEAQARIHSPVGLDISAHTPPTIALSIAAEVQAVLAARAAGNDSRVARAAGSISAHVS